MRFQVPQFIEIEDKVIGPLTIKQFIYLAGGAGLSFLIYVLINNIIISAVPIMVLMAISVTFGFYKINKRPFINVVESAFKYYVGPKLYIWKREDKSAESPEENIEKDMKSYSTIMVPKISDSKLKDLTWSLDIKESIYSNKNQK